MSCTMAGEQVEIVDQHAFTELATEWEGLLQRSYDNRVFLTPTWYRIWWTYFGEGEARIVTARDEDGGLVGLLPLQVREGVLSLVGDYNVADYMDGVATKHGAQDRLTTLWKHALPNIDHERIELRHVPSASPLIPSLEAVLAERGESLSVADDEICPVAILCSNWEGYLQMLTKKQRHEIRRKLRRALEGVEWEWRTVRTQEDLDRDLPIYFALHEASAREKARFMTPHMRTYFAEVASTFLRENVLRLSIFRREGVDVAATMSFLYRGRYLLYNSGYDPGYAAQSPGIAAVSLAMQDAIAQKAVAFDFLSGDEPYKYQFGASNTHTSRAEAARS